MWSQWFPSDGPETRVEPIYTSFPQATDPSQLSPLASSKRFRPESKERLDCLREELLSEPPPSSALFLFSELVATGISRFTKRMTLEGGAIRQVGDKLYR